MLINLSSSVGVIGCDISFEILISNMFVDPRRTFLCLEFAGLCNLTFLLLCLSVVFITLGFRVLERCVGSSKFRSSEGRC